MPRHLFGVRSVGKQILTAGAIFLAMLQTTIASPPIRLVPGLANAFVATIDDKGDILSYHFGSPSAPPPMISPLDLGASVVENYHPVCRPNFYTLFLTPVGGVPKRIAANLRLNLELPFPPRDSFQINSHAQVITDRVQDDSSQAGCGNDGPGPFVGSKQVKTTWPPGDSRNYIRFFDNDGYIIYSSGCPSNPRVIYQPDPPCYIHYATGNTVALELPNLSRFSGYQVLDGNQKKQALILTSKPYPADRHHGDNMYVVSSGRVIQVTNRQQCTVVSAAMNDEGHVAAICEGDGRSVVFYDGSTLRRIMFVDNGTNRILINNSDDIVVGAKVGEPISPYGEASSSPIIYWKDGVAKVLISSGQFVSFGRASGAIVYLAVGPRALNQRGQLVFVGTIAGQSESRVFLADLSAQ